MQDQFGRTIEYLRLSVTDRCNLRCRYCMPEKGVAELSHGNVLRYEEMLRVVAAACRLGIRKVRVTGGEPLVRRGIVSFVGQPASLPEKPEITLTTNGFSWQNKLRLSGPLVFRALISASIHSAPSVSRS